MPRCGVGELCWWFNRCFFLFLLVPCKVVRRYRMEINKSVAHGVASGGGLMEKWPVVAV